MKRSFVAALVLAAACSSASEPTPQPDAPTPKLLTAHVAASDTSAFQPDAPQDTLVRRVIPATALVFKIDSVREHHLNDTTSVLLHYWHPATRLTFLSKIGPVAPIADSSSYIAIDTLTAVFDMAYMSTAVNPQASGALDWGIMDGASLVGVYRWQTYHYNHAAVVGDQIIVYDLTNQPLIAGHRVR